MYWWSLWLMLTASVGFTAWVVAGVNRLHGLPLSHRVLHIIRVGHDGLIFGYPFLLVLGTALPSGGLWQGGTFSQLGWGWQGLYIFGWIGGLGTIGHAVVYALTPAPSARIRFTRRRLDIAGELGYRPVGHGPYEKFLSIPGNEVFRLEISTQEFSLQNVPAEWDGLSILHLTDWHFIGTVNLPYFEYASRLCREMQPDLIVFTGDLIDRQDLTIWIPPTLGSLSAPLGCYFILGNHDWYLNPDETRSVLARHGWHDLGGKTTVVEHAGRRLLLGGTEVPWMGEHPQETDQPVDFRLLLSHTPDNLKWGREAKFDLILAGHNHGGQIRFPGFGPIYCPSVYGCKFASGIFEQRGMLMYVSRGLSGRHPLRINCLPEITQIVLRSKASVGHSGRSG